MRWFDKNDSVVEMSVAKISKSKMIIIEISIAKINAIEISKASVCKRL